MGKVTEKEKKLLGSENQDDVVLGLVLTMKKYKRRAWLAKYINETIPIRLKGELDVYLEEENFYFIDGVVNYYTCESEEKFESLSIQGCILDLRDKL